MTECEHEWLRAETDTAITDTCQKCKLVVDMEKKPVPAGTILPAQAAAPAAPPPKVIDNSPYGIIEANLRTKELTNRVTLALGHNSNDEVGKQEAFKYISSILMEVQKSIGDDKKDLTVCTPTSIVQAIIDAANFRLPIDGRGLAYLVKYKDKAQFQPGYKGYLYKIAEQYKDVDFTAEPVFEGDDLQLSDSAGFQTYTHKRSNPFQNDITKMIGVIACLSYTTDHGRHSKIVTLSKDEIEKIRSKAKQDFIWKEWFLEKAKAAALKRLCKIHFTAALGVQELMRHDNEENFDLVPQATDITPAKPTEKLTQLLEKGAAA